MKAIPAIAAILVAAGTVNAADIQPAIAEFNALNHARAKQLFTELVKEEQHKNLANHYLGRIALGAGDFTGARTYLEEGIGVEPNSADEFYWLATTCSALLGRPSQAGNMELFVCLIQNLESAVNTDPKHLPSLMALHQFNANGPVAAGASREKAEELVGQIEKLSRADAEAARLIALNAAKQTDKAIALAQTMVGAYPNSEKALLEAGRTLSTNMKYPEALRALEKATARALTMDNRLNLQAAYLEIGHIAWRTKSNLDQGIAALLKAADTKMPVNANTNWAYLRLAQLYGLKGDAAQQKKYMAALDTSGVEKGTPILKEIQAQGAAGH